MKKFDQNKFPPYSNQSVHAYLFEGKDFQEADPTALLEEEIAAYCKEHSLDTEKDYSKALRQMIVAGMIQDI